MVGGDDRGDDMAVELSWPEAQPPAGRRPPPPAGALAATTGVAAPVNATQADGPSSPARPDTVSAAQVLAAVQRVGADVTAVGRAQQRALSRAVQELSDRLSSFEQAGADRSVAGAIHTLEERLRSIEAAATRAADSASVIVDRVEPLPSRVTAIATQVDRLAPLARAGDDAESLSDHVNRVGAGLDEVVALLRSRADGPHEDDDARFDAFVDVLASISHRQDELAAAMAVVVNRLSDRSEVAAILEWAEHREQLLGARLESIDVKLQRRSGAQPAPAGGAAIEDALFAVLEHLTTLSSLVTGTSRASSAELDALQGRILESQVSFDDVRATVHEELAGRPLLSDVDVRRIADAVTESLLENVRVEAEDA